MQVGAELWVLCTSAACMQQGLQAVGVGNTQVPKALGISSALWLCSVHPEPLALEKLKIPAIISKSFVT